MPEAQEALKEDNLMVDLDTSGKAVDVELKEADAKEVDKEQPEVEVKEQPAKEEKKKLLTLLIKSNKNAMNYRQNLQN